MFCMPILSRKAITLEICVHSCICEYMQRGKEAGFNWGRSCPHKQFCPDPGQEEPWFTGPFQPGASHALFLGEVSVRVKDTEPRRCSHPVHVPSTLTPERLPMPPP